MRILTLSNCPLNESQGSGYAPGARPLRSALEHYDYIDSLRAFAILGVIGTHTGGWMHSSLGGFKGLLNYGLYGVQLFFVASALTLSYSWNSRSGEWWNKTSDYAFRRFFRIAPLYYAAIVFYSFFNIITGRLSLPEHFLGNGKAWHFFFLHGLNPQCINTVVPGGWTIGDEMLFYLIFPLAASTIKGIKGAIGLFLVSTGFAAASDLLTEPTVSQLIQTRSWDTHFFYYWLPNQLPVFFAGIVTYHAIIHLRPQFSGRIAGKVLSLILIASAGLLFFVVRAAPELVKMSVLGGCFGLLAIALSLHAWPLLVNRITCAIGKLSYGLYLSHWIALALVTPVAEKALVSWTGNWPLKYDVVHFGCFLSILMTSLGIALVLNKCIENPGIQLGRQLSLYVRNRFTSLLTTAKVNRSCADNEKLSETTPPLG